jgi:hypothetical protein
MFGLFFVCLLKIYLCLPQAWTKISHHVIVFSALESVRITSGMESVSLDGDIVNHY